jgi:hypothetical protein
MGTPDDAPQPATPKLAPMHGRDAMNLVMVGHVDHGKSTLVGRLPHDSGAVSESRIEEIQAVCKRRGMPFEWVDARQAERDQGVTIDATHVRYRGETRDPKGLYKRVRKGDISDFTGISAPYEPPKNPELVIDMGAESADICAQRIVDYFVWNFAFEGD